MKKKKNLMGDTLKPLAPGCFFSNLNSKHRRLCMDADPARPPHILRIPPLRSVEGSQFPEWDVTNVICVDTFKAHTTGPDLQFFATHGTPSSKKIGHRN